jgi:hypothetical protein
MGKKPSLGSRGTFFDRMLMLFDRARVGNPLLWAESERAAGAAVRVLREGGSRYSYR